MQYICLINTLELFCDCDNWRDVDRNKTANKIFRYVVRFFLCSDLFSFSLKIAAGCGPESATQIVYEHRLQAQL